MKILRVVDWSRHYEKNRTRELKHMAWVPVPTKQDGDGYCTLVTHPNGAAHLGAWLAILQIAARCDIRGTLLRNNRTAHTPQSLAVISHLPAGLFEEVIPRLLHETGWLEEVDIEALGEISHSDATIPQLSAGEVRGNCGEAAASRARATEQDKTRQDNNTSACEAVFSRIWDRHPKKRLRILAEQALASVVADSPDRGKALEEIERNHAAWCESEEWTKKGSQFCPKLHEWLTDADYRNSFPPEEVEEVDYPDWTHGDPRKPEGSQDGS